MKILKNDSYRPTQKVFRNARARVTVGVLSVSWLCAVPLTGDAQVFHGYEAIADYGWNDITDTLTAGYVVTAVQGKISNHSTNTLNIGGEFKIDDTTVSRGAILVGPGETATIQTQTTTRLAVNSGRHTLFFIIYLPGSPSPNGVTRSFAVLPAPVVTFDAQGGTTPNPASSTVTNHLAYGALATTSRTGYTFAGWWSGAAGTGTQITSSTEVSNTASHTLYANWTPNTYTVTFDPQGGTPSEPATKTVTYGSAYGALPTTTNSGSTFAGWWMEPAGTESEVTAATTVTTASDHTLYAKWTHTLPWLTNVVTGSNILLSWAPEYIGCRLQVQTNLPNAAISTDWYTIPNSGATNTWTIPIDPALASVFCRLIN